MFISVQLHAGSLGKVKGGRLGLGVGKGRGGWRDLGSIVWSWGDVRDIVDRIGLVGAAGTQRRL